MVFDVIFLSYDEPKAEQRWQELKQQVPWAKRVNGVDGIPHAHVAAAKLANTEMFYVVDADAEIINFDWKYKPNKQQRKCVHVWRSYNPVNGLIYGYGGLKLFPKQTVLAVDPDNYIDFTTSVGEHMIVMQQCTTITHFNTSEFDAWKAAFRECAKLASNTFRKGKNEQNAQRLNHWCTKTLPDAEYKDAVLRGAAQGKAYAETGDLKNINNYQWLLEQYKTNQNHFDLDAMTLRELQKESARAMHHWKPSNVSLHDISKHIHHDSQSFYRRVIMEYVAEWGGLPSQCGPGKSVELVLDD